jgi:D-glycero-beta-D-manno-heptose 1-phosphate adenylyltransferase
MKNNFNYTENILSWDQARQKRIQLKAANKSVVFTNGAFDLLHTGHLRYLTYAREQGDCLIIGLNSDASVKRYKGDSRPIVPERERAEMLLGLTVVDYVVIFDEDEPKELIRHILPDILVKGADWAHYVSGRDIVEANGGKVILAEFIDGKSTTNIIKKIEESK